MITVAKDGSGDYTSVQEAIDSITSVPETVFIKNGIYKERVEIHKDNITLIGENADGTVITNNYYAFMPMEDVNAEHSVRILFLCRQIILMHTTSHLKILQVSEKRSVRQLRYMPKEMIWFLKTVICSDIRIRSLPVRFR